MQFLKLSELSLCHLRGVSQPFLNQFLQASYHAQGGAVYGDAVAREPQAVEPCACQYDAVQLIALNQFAQACVHIAAYGHGFGGAAPIGAYQLLSAYAGGA